MNRGRNRGVGQEIGEQDQNAGNGNSGKDQQIGDGEIRIANQPGCSQCSAQPTQDAPAILPTSQQASQAAVLARVQQPPGQRPKTYAEQRRLQIDPHEQCQPGSACQALRERRPLADDKAKSEQHQQGNPQAACQQVRKADALAQASQ